MPGRIKELLGKLKETRGRGAAGAHFLRTHLILKGINPDRYGDDSPDDPAVVAELERMLREGTEVEPTPAGRS